MIVKENMTDLLSSLFFCFLFSLLPCNTYSAEITNEAPLVSPRCNQFTFDATGSYDPDNENLFFLWDFGDGSKSEEPVVDHVYEKSGDYNVILTISDNSGLHCSKAETSQKIRVNIPPVADFACDEKVCVNQQVNFDGSSSYDDASNKLSYEWDFGDGTKDFDNKRVTKSFQKGGIYKVLLNVNDNSQTICDCSTAEKIIYVNEPPAANAGEKLILRCVDDESDLLIAFDASNSSDINNDELLFFWDFGDGTKGEGPQVTHKYSDIGNYDVKLIVKDNSGLPCSSSFDFVTVRINKAPKADAGPDIVACPLEEVTFDGSNSFINKKGVANTKWFFGDGETATGFKSVHRYEKPGQYQASFTIDNRLNEMCPPSRDTRIVTINSTPSIEFKAETSVCLGNVVHFDASSASDPDGDALEYYWSFGDGTIQKGGAKATHEYKQGGEYRATVIVDDLKGSNCSTATADAYVKVNTPPMANPGANLACCVGMETKFDASASIDPDGDKLSYIWDFGDGNTSNETVVSHIYQKSGVYNVTLTVDDNSQTSCNVSKAGFVAEVNATPIPVMSIK